MGYGRSDILCLRGDGLGFTDDGERQSRLRIRLRLRLGNAFAVALLQGLACARKRIALGVDQVLDLQSQLDIMTAIKPLAGAALVGFKLRELRLPKTQNIGFDLADAGHIANLEVEAVGDRGGIDDAIPG